MPSYLLLLEYDGTDFSGWQSQPKGRTVQEELETAARRILGCGVKMTASGRTDKGVHAVGQAVTFSLKEPVVPFRLQNALNAVLPRDISVAGIRQVPDGFNARYRAKKKIYEYRIWNRPFRSVWAQKYSWHIISPLNITAMRSAGRSLQGRHDFSAFAAAACGQENRIVSLKSITVSRRGGYIVLRFEADRFLYRMVRNITGTLVEAGKGRIAPGHLKEILNSGDRRQAGPTAPPQGLFLKKVVYAK